MTRGEHVDRGLFDPVDAEHVVDGVVHERTDPARPEPHRRCREVRVLADVPRLEQAVAIAPILILRPHPLEDHRQEEHDTAGAEELLPDPLVNDGLAEIAGSKLFDLVRAWRVVVDAGLEAVDPVDDRVDLDRVERARGRRRSPRVAVKPGGDAPLR